MRRLGLTITLGAAAALATAPAPAVAQSAMPDSGRIVRLDLRDGSRTEGPFVRWTTDSVVVLGGTGPTAVVRRDIVRWQEQVPGAGRSRWLSGLGWGALIGTVGGAALGVAAGGSGSCNGGGWCFMADLGRTATALAGASMGLLVGGATGALIGATMHADAWRERPDFLRP